MTWQHTVYLSNGDVIGSSGIKTTFRNDNGWLAVQFEDGTFMDYPPHMVERVRREVDE